MPSPPLTYNFDGGTNGNAVTTSDTGSGNSWTTVVIGAGTTVAYSNAFVAHGALAVEFTQPATYAQSSLEWQTLGSLTSAVYHRFYIYKPSGNPSANLTLGRGRNSAGTNLYGILMLTSGALRWFDSAAAAVLSSSALPTGWSRVEYSLTPGAGTGALEVKIFNSTSPGDGIDGTTPWFTSSASSQQFGTSLDRWLLGCVNASGPPSFTFYLDDIAIATSGWLGPAVTTQQATPVADSVDGSWTDQAGGTSLFTAIDDGTTPVDSDYIRSELSPSNSGCRVKLESLDSPQSGSRTLSWRVGKDATGGGTIDMKMQLRQGGGNSLGGGTLVQEFTRNNVDAATTYDETITGTITDYTDLYVEFYANQT